MAVHTKLTQQEIEAHLQNYPLGNLLEFKEILEGVDNSNFILTTEKGKFILTIFESRIDETHLPFFINLKLHLAKKGISCPRPIVNNFGEALVDLKGKKSLIASFLNGKSLKPQEDGYYSNIRANHCTEVGALLAQLHKAADDFEMTLKNDLGVDGWQPLFLKFKDQLPNYQQGLDAEIEENLQFLKQYWNANLPSAAVHVDLFPDNVFFDENGKLSGVIDFYFSATDALIFDFAIVVNAWCFDEKNNFCEDKFSVLLEAYEKVRKFSEAEKSFLKIALVGAAMRFLLTRLHDMFFTPKDSLVKIKDPQEYLAKLRFFREKL